MNGKLCVCVSLTCSNSRFLHRAQLWQSLEAHRVANARRLLPGATYEAKKTSTYDQLPKV